MSEPISANADALTISVVIPALNEAARIADAVQSSFAAGGDEVIVADGHSDDATEAVAARAGAVVVRSARGRGTQIRSGVAATRGDIVVVLHADNRLAEHCLDELRVAPERLPRWWGGLNQTIDDRRWIYRLVEWGNRCRIQWWGVVLGDQALFVSRELLRRVGGYADVPLLEDVELSRRLRRVSRPTLMPGPVMVDARRWKRRGVIRQTLLNWKILALYRFGYDETALAKLYR